MNDLQLHHALQNEIAELKREIYNMKIVDEKKDKEIARLTRRNVEWKCKYKTIYEKHSTREILLTRSDKALEAIKEIKLEGFTGTAGLQIKMIAEKCFLSISHADYLWYKHKKAAKG